MKRSTSGILLAVVALGVYGTTASIAAPINYGDFDGTTVMYLDVTEDTNSGDTQPLFGAPNISGDSLDFDPVGFSANSSGGGAPDQTDGQLTFMVKAKDGNVISSLSLSEAGDTNLARSFGWDPNTEDAMTQVTAYINIDILEIDGVGINNISINNLPMSFTPSNGDYFLTTDGGSATTYTTGWTGSFFYDFGPILTQNGIDGDVTKITVNLDNTLVASSSTNTSALIAKKDFDGVVITINPDPNNIPEPSTFVLAGLALVGLAARRRIAG